MTNIYLHAFSDDSKLMSLGGGNVDKGWTKRKSAAHINSLVEITHVSPKKK